MGINGLKQRKGKLMDNPEAFLQKQLQPWYISIDNPTSAQEKVLHQLLHIYGQTRYGREHHAEQVDSQSAYRKAFPVMSYPDYKPLIDQVMAGDVELLLSEPPLDGLSLVEQLKANQSSFP